MISGGLITIAFYALCWATLPTQMRLLLAFRGKNPLLSVGVWPFGHLWYVEVSDAIEYAKFYSRSYDVVIRVYDEAGRLIQTHEHTGKFKEP